MTSYELLRALSAADDEALLSAQSLLDREEPMKKHRHTTRIVRTALLAAVLALLLGITAYAAGWLTPNPVVVEGSVVYRVERQADGSVLYVPDEDARHISLTRFQTIPEDLDPAIRAKAENNLAAWEAWRSSVLQTEWPEAFRPPEGCDSMNWEPRDDGGATLRFYRSVSDGPGPGERTRELIGSRSLSPAQVEEWNRLLSQDPLPALLEEHGLKRRGELLPSRQMLSIEHFEAAREQNGLPVDPALIAGDGRYLHDAEIAARTEALFCHAPLFASVPAFDSVCWYDAGDFCLRCTLALSDGAQAGCCAYVGRYDVFHTGDEIFCQVSDIRDGSSHSCTAADGTVLSVLCFGEEAVLYVFLPDAYFCEHVHAERPLTEADLQQIADLINCSAIGAA